MLTVHRQQRARCSFLRAVITKDVPNVPGVDMKKICLLLDFPLFLFFGFPSLLLLFFFFSSLWSPFYLFLKLFLTLPAYIPSVLSISLILSSFLFIFIFILELAVRTEIATRRRNAIPLEL